LATEAKIGDSLLGPLLNMARSKVKQRWQAASVRGEIGAAPAAIQHAQFANHLASVDYAKRGLAAVCGTH